MKQIISVKHLALTTAFLTMFGILVHDTKFDHAVGVALAAPAMMASLSVAGHMPAPSDDAHTHIERVSLNHALRALNSGNPRIQPRDDTKRFVLSKKVARGTHAFDGYSVPC